MVYEPPGARRLTIAEIAKHFGLPESTARYYCKRFRSWLPHEGEGKRRRYLPESMEVLAFIVQEMHRRRNASDVEAALAARYPKGGGPAGVHAVQDQGGEALVRIAQSLEAMAATGDTVRAIRLHASALEEELAALRREVDALRRHQDEAEKLHQQDLEQLRKWLSHLASQLGQDRESQD